MLFYTYHDHITLTFPTVRWQLLLDYSSGLGEHLPKKQEPNNRDSSKPSSASLIEIVHCKQEGG